jgi:hypothetical protein
MQQNKLTNNSCSTAVSLLNLSVLLRLQGQHHTFVGHLEPTSNLCAPTPTYHPISWHSQLMPAIPTASQSVMLPCKPQLAVLQATTCCPASRNILSCKPQHAALQTSSHLRKAAM